MLSLQRFKFNSVISSFPQNQDYLTISKESGRQGTIGGELLSRFIVIFDYSQEKMYLKKGKNYRKKFEHNMSGLTISEAPDKPENLLVYDLREGSPAENCGLKEGDIITRINGKHAKHYLIAEINRLFRSKEGKKIKIKVLRQEQEITKVFRLKKAI